MLAEHVIRRWLCLVSVTMLRAPHQHHEVYHACSVFGLPCASSAQLAFQPDERSRHSSKVSWQVSLARQRPQRRKHMVPKTSGVHLAPWRPRPQRCRRPWRPGLRASTTRAAARAAPGPRTPRPAQAAPPASASALGPSRVSHAVMACLRVQHTAHNVGFRRPFWHQSQA